LIAQRDGDAAGPLDDVEIGHDQPALVPYEAGARTLRDFLQIAGDIIAAQRGVGHKYHRRRRFAEDLDVVRLILSLETDIIRTRHKVLVVGAYRLVEQEEGGKNG